MKVKITTLCAGFMLAAAGSAYGAVNQPSPGKLSTPVGPRTWQPTVYAQGSTVIARGTVPTVFELPYYDDFSDGDATRSNYTFVDVDNDGITNSESSAFNQWFWKADEKCVQYCVDQSNSVPGNDWLITPGIHLDGKHVYKASITVNMGASSNIILTIGTSTDPDSHRDILDLNGIEDSWFTTYSVDFTVDQGEGTYYLGLYNYSTSESTYFNLWEVKLEEGESSTAPATPANMTVVPDERGALAATLTVTAPTSLVDGTPVEGPLTIQMERDEWLLDKIECNPGDTVTYVDSSVEAPGEYTFTAKAIYNGEESKPVEVRSWVGMDMPSTPVLSTLKTVNRNMDVYIEWEPVVEGAHGIYFDPEGVTYTVYRGYDRNYMEPVATGLRTTVFTDTTISEELNGLQQGYFYGVGVSNEAGSALSAAKIIAVGQPYSLPQVESFPNGRFNIQPWLTDPINGSFSWECIRDDGYGNIGHDKDHGLSRFMDPYGGWDLTDSRLISPVFELCNSEKPVFSFWMFHWEESSVGYESTTCVIPEVRVDGGEWQPLSDPILAAYPVYGWVEHRFSLSDFKDSETVQFGLRGQTEVNWMYYYIDEIRVEEEPSNDLMITDIYGHTDLDIDDYGAYHVGYYNRGVNDAANFKVELLVDGKVVNVAECDPLAVGAEGGVDLSYQFNATTVGSHEVQARLVYDEDINPSNDLSEVLSVNVRNSFYPAVTGLSGRLTGNNVAELSWDIPVLPSPDETVTDGAEDYEPWLINGIGNWKTIDGDGLGSGYYLELAEYKWPNCETNQAFIVWTPGEEILSLVPSLTPHTGDKCFLSWLANVSNGWDDPVNDDYLVSSEVKGGTKVSFFVKGISTEDQNETFEVMYSTSGRDASDFTVLHSGVATSEWSEVEVQLPDEARFFAIHYTASFQVGLMVDDIEYTPITGSLQLQGYNVYRNGVAINEDIVTEPMYTDTAVEPGTNLYSVAAVYDRGLSDACAPISVYAESGIESAAPASEARISVADGVLTIEGNCSVTVCDIKGINLFNAKIDGVRSIRLDHGFYIVRAGDKIVKIVI